MTVTEVEKYQKLFSIETNHARLKKVSYMFNGL